MWYGKVESKDDADWDKQWPRKLMALCCIVSINYNTEEFWPFPRRE